jgi:AcrR family transcriptional regulator
VSAPLPRVPRRRDAIATRERLVRAALDLFTTNGYLGTTTLDIAARADIAEATIYRHFTGKGALFNEAFRGAARAALAIAAAVDPSGTTRDRLDRLGRAIVAWVGEDPAMALLLFRSVQPSVLDDASQALDREFRAGLVHAVASGKQAGSIQPGSAELWAAVWFALVTFIVERVASHEWTPDHPAVGSTLEAAWAAIAYRSDRADPG